jgi:hypothetical protein
VHTCIALQRQRWEMQGCLHLTHCRMRGKGPDTKALLQQLAVCAASK